MHKAAANGHMDVLKLLIQHGGDVELADISGCTPLHTAARNGHLTCVKYLVSQGADFRMKSKKGNTAVMMAKANNQPKVAEYLSNCGKFVASFSHQASGFHPAFIRLSSGFLAFRCLILAY